MNSIKHFDEWDPWPAQKYAIPLKIEVKSNVGSELREEIAFKSREIAHKNQNKVQDLVTKRRNH